MAITKFIFPITALVMLVALLISAFVVLNNYPIIAINISNPLKNVDKQKLSAILNAQKGQSWFNFNDQTLNKPLARLSWIEKITVLKPHYGHINITITEKTPVYRWRQQYLLDSRGKFFRVSMKTWNSYKYLAMVESSTMNLIFMQKIHQNIQKIPPSFQATLSNIMVTPWEAVKLNFSNRQLVVDYENISTRLPRFFTWLKKSSDLSFEKNTQVDLRYYNGFAVK